MSKKIALITGAGSGIGKASALALMKAGFSVVVAGRREQPLAATVAEGKAIGADALAVVTDVANPESVAALFATAGAAVHDDHRFQSTMRARDRAQEAST